MKLLDNMNEFSRKNILKVRIEELIGPLNEIEKRYAPLWFYVAGNRSIVQHSPRVSIIGTRSPSEEGLKNAENLVKYLVKQDIVIVSGLALGIDTIAHKTTISQGGKTIAVLGTPIDQCYPKENCDLQEEIIRNHLVISQFQSGYPIQRKNFPIRNRTMALISDASIIVEAGDTSGSLHQGWEALRLGRSLFILDSVADNRKLRWSSEMIKYGAKIISLKNMTKELFEVLPPVGSVVKIKNVALYS